MDWRLGSDGALVLGRAGKTQKLEAGPHDNSSYWPWDEHNEDVTSVRVEGTVRASGSLRDMFDFCRSLASADLSGLDTSAVTDMEGMFYYCSKLASLDLSGWDTSAVTDMSGMFWGCTSLASLDVSGWDTSAVTDMGSMFEWCSSLSALDLSGWDTSAVTDMSYMFLYCTKLTKLDPSGWDTSAVKGMDFMFTGCSSLASLDLSGWDTSSVEGMYDMFSGCTSLAEVRLGRGCTRLADLPAQEVSGGRWYSRAAGEWFTPAQITAGRLDIADTYSTAENPFWDVAVATSHYGDILWLAEAGVSTGWEVEGGWEFHPNEGVKRGQMAAFMRRLATLAGRGGGSASGPGFFRDVDAGTSFRDEIWWLAGNDVTQGWDTDAGKEFRPNATVKRGDMAAFLHRLDGVR